MFFEVNKGVYANNYESTFNLIFVYDKFNNLRLFNVLLWFLQEFWWNGRLRRACPKMLVWVVVSVIVTTKHEDYRSASVLVNEYL